MTAGELNLATIDQTGDDEINQYVEPEDLVLCQDIANRTTHRIQTDIGSYTEGRGEQP